MKPTALFQKGWVADARWCQRQTTESGGQEQLRHVVATPQTRQIPISYASSAHVMQSR